MTEIGGLSESLEDYLEAIYHLVQEKKVARVRDIAARKGVKMSSVVGALRRLSTEELIHYRAREYVELTEPGEELAKKVVARHQFLSKFFVEVLGVDGETADDEACSIEHVLSPGTMVRMRRLVGYTERCPGLLDRLHELNPAGEISEDAPFPDDCKPS
jgi:DtxR family transcriptional regulator, Mn-dependent transcriptional regulator